MSLINRLMDWLEFHMRRQRPFTLDAELLDQVQALAEEIQCDPNDVTFGLITHNLTNDLDTWTRWQGLSMRQQQVAALICLGYSNREIADRLVVEEATVKTHVHNVLIKFNVTGRGELRLLLSGWDMEDWLKKS